MPFVNDESKNDLINIHRLVIDTTPLSNDKMDCCIRVECTDIHGRTAIMFKNDILIGDAVSFTFGTKGRRITDIFKIHAS